MSETNLDLESSLTAIMKEIKNLNNRINMMQVTINDVNTKASENVVMNNSLHEFMARFSASEVELMQPQSVKKSSKKSKKKVDINTIESLETESEEKPTSNYNVFVSLVKGDTDFAHKVANVWSSEDPSIVDDPKQIDYVIFYNTYLSSKAAKDEVPKSIKKIKKIISDKRKELIGE